MKQFLRVVLLSFLVLNMQSIKAEEQSSGLTVWQPSSGNSQSSNQGSQGSVGNPWEVTIGQSSNQVPVTTSWHSVYSQSSNQGSQGSVVNPWEVTIGQSSNQVPVTTSWHSVSGKPQPVLSTQAWQVTSSTEMETTIYNTNAYLTVTQNLYSLQSSLGEVMQLYNQENFLQQTSWSTVNQISKKEFAQCQKYFSQYLQLVAGKQNSYVASVRQIFQGYNELPVIYQKKLQQTKQVLDQDSIIAYFKKLPFQQGSFALELVQEAVGSILNYIRMRIELITVNNYGTPLTQTFLVGSVGSPSQFKQLQHAVDILEGICESNFDQLKHTRGVTGDDLSKFESNYKAIFTSYEEASSKLLITFTLKLLNQISAKYPLDLAIHADVTKMDVNLPVLKELYADSKAGLELLEEIAQKNKDNDSSENSNDSKTYFGIYDSPKAVLEALGFMMGGLLVFGGTVEQNLIEQQIQEKNLQSNIPAIQKAMSTASLLYLQAAGCYYDAQKITKYNAYSLIGKSLSMSVQSWIKAQRNDHPGTYGYAAEQYQLAYESAEQSGSSNLSFLLTRFYNMAMLNYAQHALQQYSHFGQYQSDVVEYVESVGAIPEGIQDSKESLIQNLFYSQGSTAFNGIGGLCGQVAESYKANLSSLQATKDSMQTNKKLLLQNGITVTQNISDAAKAMLVGTAATEDEPIKPAADTSMYVKYYDPASVFYGQQSYLDIFHSFQEADKAMAQAPNNPYAPLGALFTSSPVKTFSAFAQLHFTRICLMSALEARAYITNPKYAYYKNACIVSSFLSFLSAYKVYRVLGRYPELVEYCTHNLEEFKSVTDVILNDAKQRVENPKAVQLDYQMALAELQGAVLLGSQQGANLYRELIEDYVQKLGSGAFKTQFPSLFQAYAYYQAYLWSLHSRNQENAQMYTQKMQKALQELMGQIERARKFVISNEESFEKRIEMQEQLKDLQKTVEQYSTTQHYEQALFGITENDFCQINNIQETQGSAIPKIEIVFKSGAKTTLLNPLYQLARLYVSESNREIQELESNFNSTSPDYELFTTARFKKIMKNYQTALVSFGQLGLQNQVMQVEQAMTQAVAFRYFSAVVPSNIVTDQITVSKQAVINRGTAQFQTSGKPKSTDSWVVVSSESSGSPATTAWNTGTNELQPQGGTTTTSSGGGSKDGNQERVDVKKPSLLPYYLIAGWQVNISKLAKDASNIAQQASQQATEGGRIPPAMEQKQKLYSEVLGTAEKLLGKKDALEDIIKYVAVPLFRDQLESGGYEGVFRTLDEEVNLYYDQILYLIMRGMQVGNSTLKGTLEITTQPDPETGGKDIVIRGTNLPLAPIPRYRGDTDCAIFYYSLYQKFFNQTGQPVNIGGEIFFPITGEQAKSNGERGQRETDRAYLASSLQYKHKIAYLIAPFQTMSAKERFNSDFKKYSKTYDTLTKAYQWQAALISAIDMLQKKAGLGYVNVNKKNKELYQNWAEYCTLFLFGSPFNKSYQYVLGQIEVYYNVAARSSTDTSVQSDLYRKAAQLNINAAEVCAKAAQMIPQVGGYPSTDSSGYPSGNLSVSSADLKTLKCGMEPPGYALPQSGVVNWKHYNAAQRYYKQALGLYKHALAVENQNQAGGASLENSMVRSVTGLWIKNNLLASLQRAVLIGRNTRILTTQEKDHVSSFDVPPSARFEKIRLDGASGGAMSAVSGEQSLVSGTGRQGSGDAVEQYGIIKKMLLEAIIYVIPLIEITSNLMKELPAVSQQQQTTTVKDIVGRSIICSAMHNYPNLGHPVPTDKKQTSNKTSGPSILNVSAFNNTPGVISLGTFTSQTQLALPYADTFGSFVEYIYSDLVGTLDDHFEGLDNNLQVGALSAFVGQLYSLLTNLYKQTFMPELMKNQTDKANIEKAETSFQTALKAAQQQLLVNATGYLG